MLRLLSARVRKMLRSEIGGFEHALGTIIAAVAIALIIFVAYGILSGNLGPWINQIWSFITAKFGM